MTEDALTPQQLAESQPEDWRWVLGRLKTRFPTTDVATAARLVAETVALAPEGRPPEVVLGGTGVVVAVPGDAAQGITRADVVAAEAIGAAARGLGLSPDPHSVTQLELGLDTADPSALGPFYAALLGSEVRGGEPVDPTGQVPTVWWQTPAPDDTDGALPEPAVPQRWHVDVWVGHDEGEARLEAVLAAGGRLVSDRAAPSYWVVEDADGNRSCICTPRGRS